MMRATGASEHVGPVLHEKNGFKVIDCTSCEFLHVSPVPSAEDLEHIYRHEYYATEKPLYIDRYLADQTWWNLVNDDRLDDLEKVLGGERGRLLDLGSGPGLFLERAGLRGWNAVGVEPSQQAAAHCHRRGLKVFEQFLTADTAPRLGTFDAVHSAAVLEHLPTPADMLRLLRSMLRPGGGLLIVVPNDENPIQKAAVATQGLAPWWIAPPHHLNYFTPNSLTRVVERTGFEVVDVYTSFAIDQFLLMGEVYIANDEVGRSVHQRRMAFELAMNAAGMNETRKDMQRAQASVGIGREIVVSARAV